MILAKDTSQITAHKENIAYAILSADCRFLSAVNANRCNIKTCICPAKSCTPFKPVDAAFSRAYSTGFKDQPFIAVI